jgi:hypothetical protein
MDAMSARFLGMPHTKLGWWSVGLSLLFTFLFVAVISEWFHFPGMLLMSFGLIGGILNLSALIWKHERSWLMWLMLLPGLFAIAFTVGEILYPH